MLIMPSSEKRFFFLKKKGATASSKSGLCLWAYVGITAVVFSPPTPQPKLVFYSNELFCRFVAGAVLK